MKVQGHFMQARFIEIHEVFSKKKSDTFLTDHVLSYLMNEAPMQRNILRCDIWPALLVDLHCTQEGVSYCLYNLLDTRSAV